MPLGLASLGMPNLRELGSELGFGINNMPVDTAGFIQSHIV